jgi:hypothetical protein
VIVKLIQAPSVYGAGASGESQKPSPSLTHFSICRHAELPRRSGVHAIIM